MKKVTGKDLLEIGIEQNKDFGKILEYINSNNISIDDKEHIIKYYNNLKPVIVEAFEQPVKYSKNIRFDTDIYDLTEYEKDNTKKVFASMDSVMKSPTVVDGCIMPDACPTGEFQIPVGGVVVTENAIHPNMHSADICCSVMMTNLGKIDPKRVLDSASSITHFGPGGRTRTDSDINGFRLTDDLIQKIESNKYLQNHLSIAISHLGTQGDGNHFLYVGVLKSTGDTVLVTHHGSRGFGANLYKTGMKIAESFRKELSPTTKKENAWIPFNTDEGQEYWKALQIVREWTKSNHSILHNKIADDLKTVPLLSFWNEHNFVFKKGNLFYHAKGATPLDDSFVPDSYNGLRLIPLNMSQPVLIVKGETTKNNLGFAPHGAGRNTSRTVHKKDKLADGVSTYRSIFEEETKGLDVRFWSNRIDISELPSAYKDADSVRSQMKEYNLGCVVDTIEPYGCIMAGDVEKNHWKKKL